MVDFESRLNSLRVKRLRRLDLPTPESPISTTEEGNVSKYGGRGSRRQAVGCLLTLEKELRARENQHKQHAKRCAMHILTSYSSFAMIVLGKRCGCVEAAVQDVRCNCCRNAAAVCFGEIPLACGL
jgi:hypothetical protein